MFFFFFFFCSLHFLIGLPDQTETSLKACDWLLYDDRPVGSLAYGGYSKGESGTLRLIRTTPKAVQTHGYEKSGRISNFFIFLCEEVGFPNASFIPFKENRFNVLFYRRCGGKDENKILKSVKDENKLLKVVHSDLQVKSYLCGCRALGLINKFVTGPLWRLLDSGVHILDMNKHYQKCLHGLFLFIC